MYLDYIAFVALGSLLVTLGAMALDNMRVK